MAIQIITINANPLVNPLYNAFDFFIDFWSALPGIFQDFTIMFIGIFGILAVYLFLRK